MTATNDKHRPLLSGIRIRSYRGEVNPLPVAGAGTLTGRATRIVDSETVKVLVTNLHIMAGHDENRRFRNPSESNKGDMYQGLGNPSDKVGGNLVWKELSFTEDNYVDLAICELKDDVAARFALHDDQHNDPEYPDHSFRTIIAGTIEPTEGMTLTLLGQRAGERTATVVRVNQGAEAGGLDFAGLMRLRTSTVSI